MRKNIFIGLSALLVIGVTVSGCGKTKAPEPPKTRPLRAVRLVPVEKGNLPRTVTVTGTLAADEEVVSSFKVSGRISRYCG